MVNQRTSITPAAVAAAAKGDFANFVVALTPGGIEAQEAQGQKQFIQQATLPIRLTGCTEAQLAGLGFVLGKPVDELFRHCTLPSGWYKDATDHDMHSTIKDADGRVRVRVFYKAAFYDRRAEASLEKRYGIGYVEEGERFYTVVKDHGEVVLFRPEAERPEARQQCYEWLAGHFPNWENPLAYWD